MSSDVSIAAEDSLMSEKSSGRRQEKPPGKTPEKSSQKSLERSAGQPSGRSGRPKQKAYSRLVQQALVFAARKHTTPRKGTDVPYITHPAHVALLLARHGFDEKVLAAAILHDVLEDTATTPEELSAAFGPEVTGMVAEISEPQFDRPRDQTWDLRKRAKLEMLQAASPGTLAIAAADRVHNTANILEDISRHGPVAWNVFNSSPERILAFGRRVLEILRRRFPHPLTEEYARLLAKLEQAPLPE
jgi:(p)ppGpp synthase/HD superfamily hydrolase